MLLVFFDVQILSKWSDKSESKCYRVRSAFLQKGFFTSSTLGNG